MDQSEREISLLIEQRNHLIKSISFFVDSLHKYVFAVLTGITAIFALYTQYPSVFNPEIIFVLIQLFFILVFFLLGLLFTMNNDRDYIRAIDVFLKEKHEITSLFYQGELSYQHINKKTSKFTVITFFVAAVVVALFAVLAATNIDVIVAVIKQYTIFSLVVGCEMIGVGGLVFANLRYKAHGKSRVYVETLSFLKGNPLLPKSDNPKKTNNRNRKARKKIVLTINRLIRRQPFG